MDFPPLKQLISASLCWKGAIIKGDKETAWMKKPVAVPSPADDEWMLMAAISDSLFMCFCAESIEKSFNMKPRVRGVHDMATCGLLGRRQAHRKCFA